MRDSERYRDRKREREEEEEKKKKKKMIKNRGRPGKALK